MKTATPLPGLIGRITTADPDSCRNIAAILAIICSDRKGNVNSTKLSQALLQIAEVSRRGPQVCCGIYAALSGSESLQDRWIAHSRPHAQRMPFMNPEWEEEFREIADRLNFEGELDEASLQKILELLEVEIV